MKHGSVSQRHTRACPRNEDGTFAPHRCKGSWRWVLEYGRDSTGKRMQTSKAGFPTKAAAQTALKEAVQTLLADVHVTDITVADYLSSWLTGKHALKPKTVDALRRAHAQLPGPASRHGPPARPARPSPGSHVRRYHHRQERPARSRRAPFGEFTRCCAPR